MNSSTILAMLCAKGIGRKKILSVIKGDADIDISTQAKEHAKTIIDACDSSGISLLNYYELPDSLKSINDPPVLLFVKGNKKLLYENVCDAIVGTRAPSEEGQINAKRVTQSLVDRGRTIVSGLAIGVDTIAHRTCLEKSGQTIAVLPSPIDKIYPSVNRDLAGIIANNGCLISEYMPRTQLQRYFFVQRDRLQAALSQNVYVIESSINDGTMHTANYAINYGKELFCCSYSIKNERNEGNFYLLKDKAKEININSV
ncbi:MAG: DNA-processing protein DprA [Bacillota bacterium]|nr:DNA-processing protein DprA [Bacillota bacterium]